MTPLDSSRRRALLSHGRLAAATLVAGCTGLGALAGLGCTSKPQYNATDITGADFGRRLELDDQHGKRRTLESFRGRTVLLFFGFTQCPDVCPTALTRTVEIARLLGSDAARVQVVFVTVDPERDTAQILGEYMAAFDPGYVALRGSVEETAAAAREFRVYYAKVPTGSSYTMDHTAITYVIDDGGRLRLAAPHGQSAQQFVDDLRQLWRSGAPS